MDRLEPFRRELDALCGQSRLRVLREVRREGTHAVLDGQALLNLSSNDYLGLGSECGPQDEPERSMAGASSRLLSGNHPVYGELETQLGELYGGRSACVFSSGYHANAGICPALAQRGDVFFADKLVHASLIDGMRLSGATVVRYRHLDYDHLARLLQKRRPEFRRSIIVTESVFSMDGDVADLKRLIALRDLYDSLLMVDEAHAVGVFGRRGLGITERDGLIDDVDVLVGTFGKAFGSFGAYAVTDEVLKAFLVNRARTLIFTTALPPAVVAWTRRMVARAVGMDAQRKHVLGLAERLREELARVGARTAGRSHIVPIIVGDDAAAVALAERLRQRGMLVFPIRPPTVPEGTARVRVSLTANLVWDDIAELPGVVGEYLREAGVDKARRP